MNKYYLRKLIEYLEKEIHSLREEISSFKKHIQLEKETKRAREILEERHSDKVDFWSHYPMDIGNTFIAEGYIYKCVSINRTEKTVTLQVVNL